jgi:hypothetical protein
MTDVLSGTTTVLDCERIGTQRHDGGDSNDFQTSKNHSVSPHRNSSVPSSAPLLPSLALQTDLPRISQRRQVAELQSTQKGLSRGERESLPGLLLHILDNLHDRYLLCVQMESSTSASGNHIET